MSEWYEELFTNYAEQYDKESFTQGTIGEVDFIEKEIDFNKSIKILDVGCGTGRHSIELARRGYSVFGIDLSDDQLAMAKRKAQAMGVSVTFEKHDARNFNFHQEYELAIMICEGAFPLMETDEMNFQILSNVYNSLAPGGKLIFTTLNGLFPLFHSVKDFINKNIVEGQSAANTFDLMTFRDHSTFEMIDGKGVKKVLQCNERYYVPSEITWLLKSLGFAEIAILGCQQGAFSRNDNLSTDDYEMLIIASKPAF
jgi:2-polyprenyl-3-methyl-5-hydroxy-6-metoxy-1,4-benzoquinol methylase